MRERMNGSSSGMEDSTKPDLIGLKTLTSTGRGENGLSLNQSNQYLNTKQKNPVRLH